MVSGRLKRLKKSDMYLTEGPLAKTKENKIKYHKIFKGLAFKKKHFPYTIIFF